jgi:hypothetical protein
MILPLNKRLWSVKFTPTQQEREDRIIVYTPIVAIPALVIISLEYEPDREQVGGGERECVNQDENRKDGKNPRRRLRP